MKKSKKAKPDRRAPMTRDEALGILAEIVRTPVGEIDEAHPLAQEVRRDEVRGGDKPVVARVMVKMPDKLVALRIIGAWNGWEKGTAADNKQADALATLTAFVRSRRRKQMSGGHPLPEEAPPLPVAAEKRAARGPQALPTPLRTEEQFATIRSRGTSEGDV